jgi:hypothetical protein
VIAFRLGFATATRSGTADDPFAGLCRGVGWRSRPGSGYAGGRWCDVSLATLVASHGVLDACTTGGKGVEFFWPLDTTRYFLPWQFIPVAPIGSRMLSPRGFRVLLFEAVLFLPAWLYAFWPRRRPPAADPLPPVAGAG